MLWNSFCVHLRGAHNLPGIQDGGSLSTYLFCALPLWFLILHSCSFWSTKVRRAAEEYQILQWLSNASEFPTESILRRLFNYCINWSLLLQPTVILESPFLKLKKKSYKGILFVSIIIRGKLPQPQKAILKPFVKYVNYRLFTTWLHFNTFNRS